MGKGWRTPQAAKCNERSPQGPGNGKEINIGEQSTDGNSKGVVTVPSLVLQDTVQSIKLLTAQQKEVLAEPPKLTRALEKAKKKMRRLENKVETSVTKKEIASVSKEPIAIVHRSSPESQSPAQALFTLHHIGLADAQNGFKRTTESETEDQTKGNWADIDRCNLVSVKSLPSSLMSKVQKVIHMLDANKSRVKTEPKPAAAYFKNI